MSLRMTMNFTSSLIAIMSSHLDYINIWLTSHVTYLICHANIVEQVIDDNLDQLPIVTSTYMYKNDIKMTLNHCPTIGSCRHHR